MTEVFAPDRRSLAEDLSAIIDSCADLKKSCMMSAYAAWRIRSDPEIDPSDRYRAAIRFDDYKRVGREAGAIVERLSATLRYIRGMQG
jgi:hypothetical protein